MSQRIAATRHHENTHRLTAASPTNSYNTQKMKTHYTHTLSYLHLSLPLSRAASDSGSVVIPGALSSGRHSCHGVQLIQVPSQCPALLRVQFPDQPKHSVQHTTACAATATAAAATYWGDRCMRRCTRSAHIQILLLLLLLLLWDVEMV